MATFSWNKICCEERVGADGTKYRSEVDGYGLTAVHKDTERILTSSSFRRLQGKTQVYPFPQTDFVRNRLTHTMEVAHIGRTIAAAISNRAGLKDSQADLIPQVVYNGCLLHDIGNPPFGHSGEYSIREFFQGEDNIEIVRNAKAADLYKNDLIFFDGNAQGFRIVTRLAGWKKNGGLRLSATTLTAMVKYAYSSGAEIAQEKEKFGFMASEVAHAKQLFEICGLVEGNVMYRNPLSLIVEAADDIAYLTSDLQDGHRNGDLRTNEVMLMLKNLVPESEPDSIGELDKEDEDYDENAINYLRSRALSFMMKAAIDTLYRAVFKDRTQVRGDAKFEVWSNSKAVTPFDDIANGERAIREASNKLMYRGRRKISLQIAGGRIIKFVLRVQLTALNEIYKEGFKILKAFPEIDKRASKTAVDTGQGYKEYAKYIVDNIDKFVSREAAQIFWGMPAFSRDEFRSIIIDSKERELPENDPRICYCLIQLSLDFVAGTTDKYLSDYSKMLSGPSIS